MTPELPGIFSWITECQSYTPPSLFQVDVDVFPQTVTGAAHRLGRSGHTVASKTRSPAFEPHVVVVVPDGFFLSWLTQTPDNNSNL
ncbi:hypothetical protein VTO42DRAFT_67 [Malbranchea cinnamomea]